MQVRIVFNDLRDAIYAKVDAAIADHPDAAPDRDYFYYKILDHFDQHGVIPEFTLQKREASHD